MRVPSPPFRRTAALVAACAASLVSVAAVGDGPAGPRDPVPSPGSRAMAESSPAGAAAGASPTGAAAESVRPAVAPEPASVRFVDVAAARGLVFLHDLGRDEIVHAVETTGSGACVLDLEGDGDDDIFLVQGAVMEIVEIVEDAGVPVPPPRRREPSRLFRNDGGRFIDVSVEAGLTADAELWGMGCAVADVDGDGDDDLLETGHGADRLLLNDGAGRFSDAGERAGVADPRWTTSAGFADFDGDGDLDLYVGAYVDFRPDGRRCEAHDIDVTCGPRDYDGIRGRLWRNEGVGADGVPRFVDVTEEVGAVEPVGKTLGVLFEDLTGDGWPDLYVANDTERNTLLVNVGSDEGRRFRDRTLIAGVGYSAVGLAEAGMGVDAADLDGRLSASPDLVVTNFHLETNTLYAARGPARYADVSDASGLGDASLRRLAFGVNAADFDLDGDVDLFVANGHVEPRVAEFDTSTSHAQADQILLNVTEGDGPRFEEATDAIEAAIVVSRASSLLDFDEDGDLDVLVSANAGPAQLLENRTPRQGRHWIAVRLAGPAPNTRGVGARVALRAAGREQVRRARTASSFLATSSATLHFGLGPAEAADIVVHWPDGATSRHPALAADTVHRLQHPALGEASSTPSAPSAPSDPADDTAGEAVSEGADGSVVGPSGGPAKGKEGSADVRGLGGGR